MFDRYLILFLVVVVFSLPVQVAAQHRALRDIIAAGSAASGGTVGVAVMTWDGKDSLEVNGSRHFPMQSVMKFPLAIAILHRVDQGKLALNQKIHLTKEDLSIPAVSPIRDKYPEGNIDLTIAELLSYTVSQSDNNGCDKLFQLLGGPKAVNDYLHSKGLNDINIVATEKEMGRDWQTQYTNWCTPNAMVRLLYLFDRGHLLSAASHDFLWKLMIETVNGPRRLKGKLPEATIVAHKPGTSGVNSQGIAAATNDVGIIQLADGRRLAIAIFITDATADLEMRESAIAEIGKWVYDCYQEN